MADPTRRSLYEYLSRKGEATVGALTAFAGISQPAISKHLGIMRQAGLVRDRREGREVHYSANPKGLRPLIDWMSFYAAMWETQIDRLEDLLKRMDQ